MEKSGGCRGQMAYAAPGAADACRQVFLMVSQTGSDPLQPSRRIHTLTCLPDPIHRQVWVGQCWPKPAGGH